MDSHCGFVAIIGRPNVGKSTLLNRFLGQKLSITSRKPQTTRHQFLGIKTIDNYQLLFVDTPGIDRLEKSVLAKYLNQVAQNSVMGVDVVLFVIEALSWTEADDNILNMLKNTSAPIIVVINKIDRLTHPDKFALFFAQLESKTQEAPICSISALKGLKIPLLEDMIKGFIPQALHIYPADNVTDRSIRFIAAERIREKLTRRLGDELPFSITVSIDEFIEDPKLSKIYASIRVSKESQKGIVIGKNGKILKSVGTDARRDLEAIIGTKVFLKLWVKVRSGWVDDIKALKDLGYDDW